MASPSKPAKTTNNLAKAEQDQKSLGKYFRGVRSEFKKVIWPTKKQIFTYSLVVIVVSILVALAIYGLDYGIRGILSLFIKA